MTTPTDALRATLSTDVDDPRARCPVAHSEHLGTLVLRHGDVNRVLADHETLQSDLGEPGRASMRTPGLRSPVSSCVCSSRRCWPGHAL